MQKLKRFYWVARDRFQQKQKGFIVAESKEIATLELLQRGLQQIKLQQHWQLNNKPSYAEICDLLNQLSVLLKSAIPLKQSLHILWKNCTNIVLNQWIKQLIQDLEAGLAFSQALEKQGKFLNFQERQLIKIGEITGKLSQVCEQIAQHKQQSLSLQRKIQKILLYPVMVLAISLVLTLLLLIFIVPQFAEMYGDNQEKLPVFTALLLNLSSGLQQYILHFFLLLFLIVFLIRQRLKHSLWLNQQKHKLIAHIPVINQIVQLSRLIGFCRSLFLMLHSGIPLNQALGSFLPQKTIWQKNTSVQGDLVLMEEVKGILSGLEQGHSLSRSISSRLFPIQVQQMLEIGEQSGKLASMLQHIADSQQQQLDHRIDLLSQMLEPLLMVIIGGLIGLIMLGMYLPIFNMGQLIQ